MSRNHSLSGHTLAPKQFREETGGGVAMGDVDFSDISVEALNPLTVALAGIKSTVALVTSSSVQDALAAGDKVTTTADGSGSISISDFKKVGGVCTPINFVALSFAMALQQQMNRVAQMKGWSKIGVDGKIGPGTMALFTKIKAASPLTIMGDTSSCAFIAADADVLAVQVGQFADTLKAPLKVPTPASGAASIVTTSGKTVIAPIGVGAGASVGGAFGGMSDTQKLVFAGLVGGIGYVVYKKSKKGKRR